MFFHIIDTIPVEAPSDLKQILKNHNTIGITWSPLATINEDMSGLLLKIWLLEQDGKEVLLPKVFEFQLSLSVVEYQFVDLDPNSVYRVSISVVAKKGNGVEATLGIYS